MASVTVGDQVTEYGSFEEAMGAATAASSPATVTLLTNVTLSSLYNMRGGDVTLVTGDYVLSISAGISLSVFYGILRLADGVTVNEYNGGGLVSVEGGSVLMSGGSVFAIDVNSGSLTVSGGSINYLSAHGGSTIVTGGNIGDLFVVGGSTVIKGGTIANINGLEEGDGSISYPVDSVSVSGDSAITAGNTVQLSATLTPEVANGKNTITWSSSAPGIATVDTNGLVTGVSAGTATITATAGSPVKSDSVIITVTVPTQYTVTFSPGYEGGAILTEQVENGTPVAEPADPTRDGYIFKGWFNGNTPYEFNTNVTGPLTLTAHWAKAVASVTINGTTTPYESFEAAMDEAQQADEAMVTLHDNVALREDYDISGGDVTLDTNGHQLSADSGKYLDVRGGVLRLGDDVNVVEWVRLRVYSEGRVYVTGGKVYKIEARGGSVEVSSGSVKYLEVKEGSAVVSGGDVKNLSSYDGLTVARGDARVKYAGAYQGGLISIDESAHIWGEVEAWDSGVVNLYGGTIAKISEQSNGTFHVYGGTVGGAIPAGATVVGHATGLSVSADGAAGDGVTTLNPEGTLTLTAAPSVANHSHEVPVTWTVDETGTEVVLLSATKGESVTVTANAVGTATITASVPGPLNSGDVGSRAASVCVNGKDGYQTCSATFTVTVEEEPTPTPPTPPSPSPSPSYQGIRVASGPNKTEYAVGEELDLTGLEVREYWSDGSSRKLGANEYEVSGFDSSEPGVRKVTVALKRDKRYSVSFEVTVMAGEVTVYRLYNKDSGEHLYTANTVERDHLASIGWRYEGVAFTMSTHGTPVHRLYLPGDMHLFTVNKSEYEHLKSLGWRDEGIAWYEPADGPATVRRLYNPSNGDHLLTASTPEYAHVRHLPAWRDEGPAFTAR